MASVVKFIRKGGKMVTDMDEVKEYVLSIIGENEALKTIIEKQGAIIVSIKDELGVMSRKLNGIEDEITKNYKVTDEIKHVKFVGQEVKMLDKAREAVEDITGSEVRELIHSAALAHEGGRRKGFTYIYNKLRGITGFDVYEVGQITLKKSDGIDGWRKDPSYINAILKEGVGKEAAIICKQILADK